MPEITCSVVVPVRNGMPHVVETAKQIISLASPSTELIFRDNGSSDGTAEFLRELGKSSVATVVLGSGSLTMAESWTEAVKLAKGKWIKLLPADDLLFADGLEHQLSIAESLPNVSLISSRRQVIGTNGRILIPKLPLRCRPKARNRKETLDMLVREGRNIFGEPGALLMRRSALAKELPFAENYLADLDMAWKILSHGQWYNDCRVVSAFRISASSGTSTSLDTQEEQTTRWFKSLLADSGMGATFWRNQHLRLRIAMRYHVRRLIVSIANVLN